MTDHKICTIIMCCARTHLMIKSVESAIRHGIIREDRPGYICRTVDHIYHEQLAVRALKKKYPGMIHDAHHHHGGGTLNAWKEYLAEVPECDIVMKLDDDIWIASDGFMEAAIARLDADPELVSVQPVMPISCQGAEMVIDALDVREEADEIEYRYEHHPFRKKSNKFKGWNFAGTSFEHQVFLWDQTTGNIPRTIQALKEKYPERWVPVDMWYQIGSVVMKRSWIEDVFRRREGADELMMNMDLGMSIKHRTDPVDPMFRAEIDAHSLAIHFSYNQFHQNMLHDKWEDARNTEY